MTTPRSNEVAVVTGAGGGIGRAIARALAATEASLCLIGRTLHSLEETAELCLTTASRVIVSVTDLTAHHQVEQLRHLIEEEFGRVDILIHSAGVIFKGRIDSQPAAEFDSQYQANVRAPYLLTQTLLPLLRVHPGQIVVVNSSAGLRTSDGASQFSATQHALRALTDTLRGEVNPDGIRVLSVFLGRTATSRQAALYEQEGKIYHPDWLLQPEDVASMVVAALALPRTAEVTEIHMRPLLKSY